MTISAGTRLGPYEIVSPLGTGGMGEVWRARDTRLSRDVALKVLPAELALDRERLNRFEQEARSASALNHPNIVAIHDVGRSGDTSYIAMELVEGKTVREILVPGALPWKRALSIAVQIADGLAKAHAAGIVHRDLKPENVMVSGDGFVKVLDFGLAKLVAERPGNLTDALTMAGSQTASGVIVGTVGYMSPEQAGAAPLDFRSDQFALGAILYEMVAGRRAFQRASVVDTLSAILHEEPEPLSAARPGTPLPLQWLIERCLAKEPDGRYASTRDLAHDLASLRDHLSQTSSSEMVTAAASPRQRRMRLLLAALLPAAVLLVLAGLFLGRWLERRPAPSFRQLTFRRGTIRSARFSPDGQTVVYAAAWGGQPLELFTVRPGIPESRSLGPIGANEIAVSSSGELALVIRNRYLGLFPGAGTLVRMPFEGGAAPREILESIVAADWSPDGSALAVVRWLGPRQRLEYPVGNVLYDTGGWISQPRVSPDGRLVAFLDHPSIGDDHGTVAIVDRAGKGTPGGKRTLGGAWSSVFGLAWAPGGKEIWFTASKAGSQRELRALSISGRERLISRFPGMLTLLDIARDGRVLISRDVYRFETLGLAPGGKQERDLSWFDLGLVNDISRDGKKILLNEVGEGGGEGYSVYLRDTDGSPAVRLGPGWIGNFSPDGKWVLTTDIRADPPQLVLLPTGPGEPVPVTRDRIRHAGGRFLPDGKRIVVPAKDAAGDDRLYVMAVSGGAPQPLCKTESVWSGEVSPDGHFVAASGPEGIILCQISGGDPRPVPGTDNTDLPVQWSPDGRFLYVQKGQIPARVFRIDVASGQRQLWKELALPDPAGVVEVLGFVMTPDASAYASTFVRILSDLYVADGLR